MPITDEVRTLDLSPSERYLLANLCSRRWWELDRARLAESLTDVARKEIVLEQQRLAALEERIR